MAPNGLSSPHVVLTDLPLVPTVSSVGTAIGGRWVAAAPNPLTSSYSTTPFVIPVSIRQLFPYSIRCESELYQQKHNSREKGG